MLPFTISTEDRICREFACWAARRAAKIAKCRTDFPIVLAVEQYLRGEIGFDEVRALRKGTNARTTGAIAGAGVIGSRVRGARARKIIVLHLISPALAANLSASSCADDSAQQAAESAIKYAALTARNANRWSAVSSEGKEKAYLEAELQNRLKTFCRH